MRTCIILVKEDYMLDALVYDGEQYDNPLDDDNNWKNFNPNHFVGIFKGMNENEAIKEASETTGFNSKILEASEIMN